MPQDLNVTNGDGAAELIGRIVKPEPVLPWRDMLHDGPVPAGLDLDALSAVRAQYLAGAFGLEPGPALVRFRSRDHQLRHAIGAGARITLWFEHDLYDQLQLIQLLAILAEADVPPERVRLAQADRYLTEMSAEALARLAAPLVTAEQMELARDAWAAFRAPTPEPLAQLLRIDTRALPWLQMAVARLLEELPAPGTGLSRTERRIIERVGEAPWAPGRLFGAVSNDEPARFLGDAPFFARLDALAAAPAPLVEGLPGTFPYTGNERERRAYATAPLSLTALGKEVLAGWVDRAAVQPIDRWLGGTHLHAEQLWRWTAGSGTLSGGG